VNCDGNVFHENICSTLPPTLNYFPIILIISITFVGVSVIIIYLNLKRFKRPQQDLDFL
jgi:hypothetical protein